MENIYDMTDTNLVGLINTRLGEVDKKHHGFLSNCESGIRRYGKLTQGMRGYAISIARGLQAEEVRAVMGEKFKDMPSLAGVYEIFKTASVNLKRPAITFETTDLGKLKITVAGVRSRYAGQLMITDGGPFGDNKWYGRINSEGGLEAGREALSESQLKFLTRFSTDPVKLAKEYSQDSGNCCFCHKTLNDERSVHAGYGKKCASNYDLPWGVK
jgi:hypothetical protein